MSSRSFAGGASTDNITCTHTNLDNLSQGKMTAAIWAFTNTWNPGAAMRLISKAADSVTVGWGVFPTNGGATGIRLGVGWNSVAVVWGIPYPSNSVWHHIAVTYDGSSTSNVPQFYLEGIAQSTNLDGAGPAGSQSDDSAFSLILGNRETTKNRAFNGFLCHSHIYNRILSINEIKQIMRIPGSIQNGLVEYHPLWGSGTEFDYSANKNHGTVTGATINNSNPPILGIMKKKRSSLHYATMFPVTSGAAPPSTSQYRFRKTLSGIGTRTFSRQVHDWGN